jgi:aspartyl-tRNA(Asn)/glutamyl-tRNA(Gln) amidotransferase subunit C
MISKEEVQHIAKLARLGLTEEEIKKFQKELSSILDYIEKLKKVDVSRIEPTSHSIKVENIIREDKAHSEGAPENGAEKLLKLVPEKKGRYLKVKSIL